MDKRAVKAAGFIDLEGEQVDLHQGELLLLNGDRIEQFIVENELPDEVEVEEYPEQYCLPGMVDAAFLPGLMLSEAGTTPEDYGEMVWQARKTVRSWRKTGVTAAGTLGAADRLDLDLHQYIERGRLKGPRLVAALSPLVPLGTDQFPYPYGVKEVSGPEDARRAVRRLIKDGAERITVYADVPLRFSQDPKETARERFVFSVEELSEMVKQAEQAGCFVHAQAVSTQAVENCARAGVRSIGCAFGLVESQLDLLRENQVALVPNLALGDTVKNHGQKFGMEQSVIDFVSQQRISPDLLVQAYQEGVEIVCGTNAALPQGDLIRECELLFQAGLPEEAVLRAATRAAAKTLKPYCEWGSFARDHYADFIFLNGNPLVSLDHLKFPAEVQISRPQD